MVTASSVLFPTATDSYLGLLVLKKFSTLLNNPGFFLGSLIELLALFPSRPKIEDGLCNKLRIGLVDGEAAFRVFDGCCCSLSGFSRRLVVIRLVNSCLPLSEGV